MVWFSERKQLEDKYYEWIESNKDTVELKDCPFNIICFLAAYNLLDENKVNEFLNKK